MVAIAGTVPAEGAGTPDPPRPDPPNPLVAQFRAARRVSVPLVAVTTPDPAATVQLLSESLRSDIPRLGWDVVNGVTALNAEGAPGRGKIVAGQRDPTIGNPAELFKLAVGVSPGTVLFVHMAHRWVTNPQVIQALWNLRDEFKRDRRTAAAACGDAPTGVSPGSPRFDGGGWVGPPPPSNEDDSDIPRSGSAEITSHGSALRPPGPTQPPPRSSGQVAVVEFASTLTESVALRPPSSTAHDATTVTKAQARLFSRSPKSPYGIPPRPRGTHRPSPHREGLHAQSSNPGRCSTNRTCGVRRTYVSYLRPNRTGLRHGLDGWRRPRSRLGQFRFPAVLIEHRLDGRWGTGDR